LLISCSDESVPQVLELLHSHNFDGAVVVGEFSAAPPRVCVR